MAATSTVHNQELETETSHARADALEAPELEQFGGATLRLVGGIEAPAPTSETPPPDSFDLYMRNTAFRLGRLGLVTIRSEIASVRSMKANIIGNDYLGNPYGPDVSMEDRLLGIIACCAVHVEDAPKKDEDKRTEQPEKEAAAELERQNHNKELEAIRHEGSGLYFDLVEGSSPQVVEQSITTFFEELRVAEISIFKGRDLARTMIPASSKDELESRELFLSGSLDRSRRLQGAAHQLRELIPALLQ